MSINLGNVLALLLLLSVAAGIPSAAGQNTFLNNTASDINDIIGNIEDFKDNLIGNVTTGITEENGDEKTSLPVTNENSSSSGGISSSDTTSNDIMINEVELNPPGNDEGRQWVELYNPTKVDTNIGNFEIITSSKSSTIKLPSSAVIEAGKTYVVDVNQQILPHTIDSLILIDARGNVKDRTPSLVDRSDDSRTWQRIPDGNNEWQFIEGTRNNLNEPNSSSSARFDKSYSGPSTKCIGSALCTEGIAIRIVDGDTLYVIAGSNIYKVHLALIKTPSRSENGFIDSTQFTRDLCLGSTVLIDQDDKQVTTSDSSIIAVAYCSSNNLNSELLDNGYATLDIQQCATSEFAQEPWAKEHGC
jgi:endonuclease YncB( thermonuclease family)